MLKSCGKCLYWDPQKPEPKLCKVCNNYRNMFVLKDGYKQKNKATTRE